MKNDQYFPHDVTAHNNIKLLRLKADKGLEGYGVYWSLLEYLRMQKNYSMPLSLLLSWLGSLVFRRSIYLILSGSTTCLCWMMNSTFRPPDSTNE
nr:Lin1244/Lin1753 domain-containing protein [uncultured Bacteroides sp.]